MLEWSALRADSAVVLSLRSRRGTHFAPCGRYVQTIATSQSLMRAARADLRLPFLATPEIAPTGYHPPLIQQWWRFVRMPPQCLQRWVRAVCCASLQRSALRADCLAVLVLVARRGTRCVPCGHSAQTVATSQSLMRAGARGHKPCAPQRFRGAPQTARTHLCKHCGGMRTNRHHCWMSGGWYPVGAISGVARNGSLRSARAARIKD